MFYIGKTIGQLTREFDLIPASRKSILRNVALFIEDRIEHKQVADLVFICTHNSRRSHIAQIWSEAAAAYFDIQNVRSYSGGTEETAFNPRAVEAMREIGFGIQQQTMAANPRYSVNFSDKHPSFDVFSKKYDDEVNPAAGFAAIMTCTHADENCPFVAGAAVRFSLPFDDPKDFDGTSQESIKYRERSLEIGREILYIYSTITNR